jgi:hypothetical protein
MILSQTYKFKIECAILNTFVFHPHYIEANIKPFKMEAKYFSTDFNKMICERLMRELEGNNCVSLLQIKLDAWIRDIKPQYISQWLEIICQGVLPMSVAKKYYDELRLQEIERLANGR